MWKIFRSRLGNATLPNESYNFTSNAPADHVRALTPGASAFTAAQDTGTQLWYWRAQQQDCSITFGSNRLGSGTYEVQVRWATVTEEGEKEKTKLTVQHAGSEPTVLELTQGDTEWHSLGIWEFRGINPSAPTPWEGIKQEGAVVNGQVSTGWVSGYFKFVRLGDRKAVVRAPNEVTARPMVDGTVIVSWRPYASELYTMSTDPTQTVRSVLVPTCADEYEVLRSTSNNLGTAVVVGRTNERVFTDADAPAGTLYYWIRSIRKAEEQAIGYTGQAWDEEAGLAYYKARWYDPSVGRFLSQDPAGEGDNHYLYVHGDPVNYTDPTGLCGKTNTQYGSVPLPNLNNFGSGSYGMNYVMNPSYDTPLPPEAVERAIKDSLANSATRDWLIPPVNASWWSGVEFPGFSDAAKWANSLGAKYLDPQIIRLAGRVGGQAWADKTAVALSWQRGFNDALAENSDIGKHLVNAAIHPDQTTTAMADWAEAKYDSAKTVYRLHGWTNVPAEVLGINKIAEGAYNVNLKTGASIGGSWDRFMHIGEGSVNTLNAFSTLAGGVQWGLSSGKAILTGTTRVIDKGWKNLIEGQAHGSGTHKFRTYREAIRMAKSGQYQRIVLNRSLRKVTNGAIDSSMRPDIVGLKGGRFDVVEVLSPSQKIWMLEDKISYIQGLGDVVGSGRVVVPH